MDKEDFLIHTMKLLQTFIDEKEEVAISVLLSQGVQNHEIPSVLYTISNMAKGRV